MSRQKVKLASGLTVRDGDTVIVTFVGKYDAAQDAVIAENGDRAWFDLSDDVQDYRDQITVAKVKSGKSGD